MRRNSYRAAAIVVSVALTVSWAASSCASSGGAAETSEAPASEGSEQTPESNAAKSMPKEDSGRARIDAPDGFEVVAHRGAPALKPENTLPSIETALDARPDRIEIDLHLSKDDQLVLWHDAFIRDSKCGRPDGASSSESTAGKPETARDLPAPTTLEDREERAKVRNLTAEQLRAFRCDRNPKPETFPKQNTEPTEIAGDDFGIVTLDEFFDFVETYATSEAKSEAERRNARELGFFLEVKRNLEHPSFIDDGFDGSGPAVMEERLVSTVRERDLVDRTAVLAPRPSLWAIRELDDEIELIVAEAERNEPLAEYAERGASYWAPNFEMVDDDEPVREAHEADLRVVPWTVNDPDEIERLIGLDVDGVLTDDPTLFRRRH